jgi:hypothetical protein
MIARKAKSSPNWFLGVISDEQGRSFTQSLDFLPPGTKYVATIYRDAPTAHWQNNPMAYIIEKFIVDNKTVMSLKLAAGGGTAISLMPAIADEVKSIKKYKK